MKKVKIFANTNAMLLEESVNSWLAENATIDIINTNMCSMGKPNGSEPEVSAEKYAFYIFYSEMQQSAMEQMITSIGVPETIKEELPMESNPGTFIRNVTPGDPVG